MRRRTRRAIAVAALAVATSALAACSSSGSGGTGDAAAGSSTTAPADPATTAGTTPPAERLTRSNGCDTGATPATAVDEEISIDIDGTTRTYLRHVPPAHDGATALPVVVDLHGYQEGARIHTAMSSLGPFGDTEGFVTVTPQGQGEVPRWDATTGSADVAFIGQVLDDVERSLCVDLDRVYVTGLSNGAFMTSVLACDLADRFAAAAPVAGIQDPADCSPSRPVPVIAFHGTADGFVGYDGGLGEGAMNLPAPDGSGRTIGDLIESGEAGAGAIPTTGPTVPEIATAWAARNGCDAAPPTETPVAADVTKLTFSCPGGAEVELYRVEGGGHTWPGSAFSASIANVVGPTTTSISANELMWAFFQAHPMPAA